MKKRLIQMLLAVACSGLLADKPLPLLDEKTTVSNQGSKSESRHHYLLVDGQAIPDTFWLVHQEGRTYRFHQRSHLWGTDGYAPVPEAFQPPYATEAIRVEDLERKWYLGKARLRDTPGHWAYLEWADGGAFADPRAIAKLAETLKLPRIVRDLMAEQLGIAPETNP